MNGRVSEDLVKRARRVVEGKRLLLVTNHRDEALRRRLENALGANIELRDVQQVKGALAAAARIATGRYHLVLVATSFVSHKSDNVIRRACRASSARYVSVKRGSLQQVAGALTKGE